MGNGETPWLSTHERFLKYTHIRQMSEEAKADLVASGAYLNDEEQSKLVTPLLTDEDQFLYQCTESPDDKSRKLVQFNFGYEHFRFTIDQPGGSIKAAMAHLDDVVCGAEAALQKRGLKGFSRQTHGMCNLANLGGFQMKLTLAFEFPDTLKCEEFFAKLVKKH